MSNLEVILLASGIILGLPFLGMLMIFFFMWLAKKMED